jgi:hypothetical protein
LEGVELRAMFYNLCNGLSTNTTTWLRRYEEYGWNVATRGPFPFDMLIWRHAMFDLFDE